MEGESLIAGEEAQYRSILAFSAFKTPTITHKKKKREQQTHKMSGLEEDGKGKAVAAAAQLN